MSSATASSTPKDGSAGLRALASVAALLTAAGLLALGVSASQRETDGPTDIAVVPGKVSVLGEAKVREWKGQTFSIEVPLEWQNTESAVVIPEDTRQSRYQRHQWARLTAGDSERARDGNWLNAQQAADARIVVEIRRHEGKFEPRKWAVDQADFRSTREGHRFGDVGPVSIGATPDGTGGRDGWRLQLASGKHLESHYFFMTCDGTAPREAWHVTFNRVSVRAEQATLQNALASLQTEYRPARRDGC